MILWQGFGKVAMMEGRTRSRSRYHSRPSFLLVLAAFLSSSLIAVVESQTCLEVIQNLPQLSSYAQALEVSGMDQVLSQTNKQFTVLAPSNDAIAADTAFTAYLNAPTAWKYHLESSIQTTIIPNQALLDSDIFDGERTELISQNGTLEVSQAFSNIDLVNVQTPDNQATNGVVHIMEGVVKNDWRDYTLRDVDQHPELQEGLSPILTRIGFDEPLNFQPPTSTGTSFVAARNRGYGDDSIARGYGDIVAELEDPNNTEFQTLTMTYNILDQNFYEQDISDGFQELALGGGGIAHMWVTKSREDGTLRFNDAAMVRQALADNGLTQIVTKPLVPPGIAMLMEYCADFTSINLKDMSQFYEVSGWNQRDLTKSIGTAQGSFNVFAPLQGGFGEFNIDTATRLSTLEWQRHLWDLLLHLTVEPAYTTEELYQIVETAGGSLQVKMLSGFNTTWEINEEGDLTVDGAAILRPYDMKGVDGLIHLLDKAPLPPSATYSVYEQTEQNPEMSTVTRLIDTVQLDVPLNDLLPITFFSAVNSAWNRIIPSLEIEDVLKNMIFEFLWFDDKLAQMDGEQITSTNGKKWNIQVIPNPAGEPFLYAPDMPPANIYISNTDGPAGLTNCSFVPGPNRTNILALTGVIHHIDCLFLDVDYEKSDPNAPTFAPIQRTAPPNAAPIVYEPISSGTFPTNPPFFTAAGPSSTAAITNSFVPALWTGMATAAAFLFII